MGDGNPALKATLGELFPCKRHQGCIWQKINTAAWQDREKGTAKLRWMGAAIIFAAPSRPGTIRHLKVWKGHREINGTGGLSFLE